MTARRSPLAPRRLRARNAAGSATAGTGLDALLLEPQSWVTRRVESVTYLDSGETRRAISLDFTLPRDYHRSDNPGTVLVPLAMLTKQPLTRLDVRDDTGRAIPVLDAEANGAHAARAVTAYLAGQITLAPSQRDRIRRVVTEPASTAVPEARRLVEELRQMWDDEPPLTADVGLTLLTDLAARFAFIVELPEQVRGRRTVIKFSYEEPPGRTEGWWTRLAPRTQTVIEAPAVGDAASYHLEVRPPLGVSALSLTVTRTQPVPREWTDRSDGPMAHVSVRDNDPGATYEATCDLRPRRPGLVTYATVAATLVTLLYAMATRWLTVTEALVWDSGRAAILAPAVLVAPAFLLALLARPMEHPTASLVYLPARLVMGLTAGTLVAASVVIAVGPGVDWLRRSLITLLAISAATAAYSWILMAMSDPPRTVRIRRRSTKGGREASDV